MIDQMVAPEKAIADVASDNFFALHSLLMDRQQHLLRMLKPETNETDVEILTQAKAQFFSEDVKELRRFYAKVDLSTLWIEADEACISMLELFLSGKRVKALDIERDAFAEQLFEVVNRYSDVHYQMHIHTRLLFSM